MTQYLDRIELAQAESVVRQEVETAVESGLLALAEDWGERSETSRELVREMADAGFFGFTMPETVGGQGRQVGYSRSLCLIRDILGYHSPTLDITFALQGLGTGAIVRMGTPAQQERYLADLVAGRTLFAFGLTEPDAGSDVLGMTTSARKVDGGYVVDGRKMFISGAPDADVYVVFARVGTEPRGREIDAFIVERGTEGFTPSGGIELASPHAIGYLDFDDCFIPFEDRIGDEGQGLVASLGTLEIYRPSVGAFAVGAGTRAWELGRDFTTSRRAFGHPLAANPVIRAKLAWSWARLEAGRALVYRAATENDEGRVSGWRSGLAKLVGTEAAIEAADTSQQLHGGRGVIAGQPVESLVRALRPTAIYEGTSEIQRSIIGREEAKRASTLDEHDAAGPGALLLERLRSLHGAPEPLLAAVELLIECEAAERQCRVALARSEGDGLRRQPVHLRLADIRVAVESLREVALQTAGLVRRSSPQVMASSLGAAALAVDARDRVALEILELDRSESLGLGHVATSLMVAPSSLGARDQVLEDLAAELLGG